ncbi:Glyoxalase/Bleomycin resistance protein/Dihydroxybiphenyl dioxygenase [Fusarium oxysporum f. sp. vasinfectum]|nr:Glyoxalase/Bleomycin resistance protein/Dihydroxybiphenyl dioxygenase [Fusarium oxysporum f. sp. vasinfectum]
MTLPFVEVSHLAQSSSFYSATLQLIGLRFLNESREQNSSIGTITYGIPAGAGKSGGKRGDDQKGGTPVLQIREVSRPFEPVKLSTLVFAVPSTDAVIDFHDCAFTANPWLSIQTDGDPIYPGGPSPRPRLGFEGGETPRRATVRDLDGNTIQVVYRQPTCPRDYFGRIIEWTYDGTTAQPNRNRSLSQPQLQPVASARSSSSSINGQSPFQPRQSPAKHGPNTVTAAEMTQRAASRADEDEPVTTTVVGAILGVAAAGAALTYGFASHNAKERERKPRQEYEPPSLPRRSTFPEKAPTVHKLHNDERRITYADYPPTASQYPPKALPYRGHGGFAPQDMYPEGYPFQKHMQNDYAPRKMHHESYPPRNLGYIEDDSSEDSPDEPVRPIQYLTQAPYDEENPWSNESRARTSLRRVLLQAPEVLRRALQGALLLLGPDREVELQRKDMIPPEVDARQGTLPPEDAYEFVETRSRHASRAPDDGFETRSRRASRPPPEDGFDTRSRRSSRPPEDGFETRSRRSSRPPITDKSRSVRARSEAGVSRSKSVVLVDDLRSEAPVSRKYDDRRSHAGSRAPKSSQSVVRGHRPPYDDERTYFSARSRPSSRAPRRSSRTEVEADIMEAPEVPEVPDAPEIPLDPDVYEAPDMPDMMPRSRARSRYNVPRMATGPDYPHMGYPSKAQSYVSARNVSLPMSGIGSSHADWDDDMVSVAPSDSISCVGVKPSRRSRKIR